MMRVLIGVTLAGFMALGLARAGQSGEQPDPKAIEAKLQKVREQLEKLRAEERVLAERLAELKASAPGWIKAEVIGVLRHKGKGECYYLSLVSPNGETRVWLAASSDKVRDQLGTLHGKAVVATGQMHQRHPVPVGSIPYAWPLDQVPEGEFYLLPFEVKAAPDPGPKK